MAERCKYACPSCGYETFVSGGEGVLMMAKTRTYQCDDCRELMDLTTEVVDPESESSAWPDWIPVDDIKCAHCSGHNIRIWNGRTCPKCGAGMVKIEGDTLMID